jgi:hypothetical protein
MENILIRIIGDLFGLNSNIFLDKFVIL